MSVRTAMSMLAGIFIAFAFGTTLILKDIAETLHAILAAVSR